MTLNTWQAIGNISIVLLVLGGAVGFFWRMLSAMWSDGVVPMFRCPKGRNPVVNFLDNGWRTLVSCAIFGTLLYLFLSFLGWLLHI